MRIGRKKTPQDIYLHMHPCAVLCCAVLPHALQEGPARPVGLPLRSPACPHVAHICTALSWLPLPALPSTVLPACNNTILVLTAPAYPPAHLPCTGSWLRCTRRRGGAWSATRCAPSCWRRRRRGRAPRTALRPSPPPRWRAWRRPRAAPRSWPTSWTGRPRSFGPLGPPWWFCPGGQGRRLPWPLGRPWWLCPDLLPPGKAGVHQGFPTSLDS
jgi:hypothetical protein